MSAGRLDLPAFWLGAARPFGLKVAAMAARLPCESCTERQPVDGRWRCGMTAPRGAGQARPRRPRPAGPVGPVRRPRPPQQGGAPARPPRARRRRDRGRPLRPLGGARRARSRRRFVLLRIHFIPCSLTYSVPLFLKRQCDRTLGVQPRRGRGLRHPRRRGGGRARAPSHCHFAPPTHPLPHRDHEHIRRLSF
jgi:hypothetical protein